MGNLEASLSACKAPGDWRTPRRFAYFRNHRVARSVLDCGGPPPLFPEAYQTVPMLTATAIVRRFAGVQEESGAAVPELLCLVERDECLSFVCLLGRGNQRPS